jgi:hypothetical protein
VVHEERFHEERAYKQWLAQERFRARCALHVALCDTGADILYIYKELLVKLELLKYNEGDLLAAFIVLIAVIYSLYSL